VWCETPLSAASSEHECGFIENSAVARTSRQGLTSITEDWDFILCIKAGRSTPWKGRREQGVELMSIDQRCTEERESTAKEFREERRGV